jgi:hypothetical protein
MAGTHRSKIPKAGDTRDNTGLEELYRAISPFKGPDNKYITGYNSYGKRNDHLPCPILSGLTRRFPCGARIASGNGTGESALSLHRGQRRPGAEDTQQNKTGLIPTTKYLPSPRGRGSRGGGNYNLRQSIPLVVCMLFARTLESAAGSGIPPFINLHCGVGLAPPLLRVDFLEKIELSFGWL